MDISKYFRESLGIWDNESRLYLKMSPAEIITQHTKHLMVAEWQWTVLTDYTTQFL